MDARSSVRNRTCPKIAKNVACLHVLNALIFILKVDLNHIYGETLERQLKLRLRKDGKLKYQVRLILIAVFLLDDTFLKISSLFTALLA